MVATRSKSGTTKKADAKSIKKTTAERASKQTRKKERTNWAVMDSALCIFMEETFKKQHREKHPAIKITSEVIKAGEKEWISMTASDKALYITEAEKRFAKPAEVYKQMAESNEAYDPAKYPKRKAKSGDVGWKYGFWPDLTNKDMVQCILCSKIVHSGVRRLKQHLAGGFPDVAMCTKTTPAIIKEMKDYIQKNAKKSVPLDDELDDDNEDDRVDENPIHPHESSTAGSNTLSSSRTTTKRKKMSFIVPQSKPKTIASMIRKPPEEVIEERHSHGPAQTTLENSTKSEEEKERVKMHIAYFFYECGIPSMPLTPGAMRSWSSLLDNLDRV